MQRFVDGLTAVHDGTLAFGKLLEIVGKGEWDGPEFTELTSVEHPLSFARTPKRGAAACS
jgi:hypothetical protein